MAGKVILEIVAGPQEGQSFTFDEPAVCWIGRGKDCTVRLPNDDAHRLVSRHHCLLEINPPGVRARDLGSRNGTWVNGTKIGQRPADHAMEQAAELRFPEQDLNNGDELRVGQTVFHIVVVQPPRCSACGAPLAQSATPEDPARRSFFCEACLRSGQCPVDPPSRFRTRCTRCGQDVSDESGADRPGVYVCSACQTDPWGLMNHLLSRAERDPADFAAIRGYRIIRELGRGGMGAVYLAEHEQTGEQVALKLMLPRVAADEHASQLFLREAHIIASLKHTNVVTLHDFGACDGVFYLTLEYCNLGSLMQWIRRRAEPVPVREAWPIMSQLLAGLEYTHSVYVDDAPRPDGTRGQVKGLVHRDLKPSNIFLSGTEHDPLVKIGDYGLAKAFDLAGLSGYTRTGVSVGTPQFQPRQQVINFKYAKPEVDVWAAAAIFYHMITGSPPRDFPAASDSSRIVLETSPVPVRFRRPDCPARVAEVLDVALIDRPRLRFQKVAELREALEAVV